jgi:hypothetical protein
MKSIFTISVFLFSFIAMGQNTDNPRVKPFLDKFYKAVEDIKKTEASDNPNKVRACKIYADIAMTQIGYIKKRDPGYDVAPLEALVMPYREAAVQAVQAHNENINNKVKQADKDGDGCASLFMGSTTVEMRGSGDLEADIASHIEQLKKYKEKTERLLAGNRAGVEVCEDYISSTVAQGKKGLQRLIKETQAEYAKPVKFAYRELVGLEAYWDAARRIYPNIKEAADLQQQIQQALTSLGTMEQAAAKADARRRERLKNTFMPKAVVTNAALDAEFKEAFVNEGWNESIIKIHILSREWDIIRNELTGAIICRTQAAAIVAKQKNGNCILYSYTIKQQYNGSGYSTVSSRYSHGVIEDEFYCENAR